MVRPDSKRSTDMVWRKGRKRASTPPPHDGERVEWQGGMAGAKYGVLEKRPLQKFEFRGPEVPFHFSTAERLSTRRCLKVLTHCRPSRVAGRPSRTGWKAAAPCRFSRRHPRQQPS